MLCAIKNCFKGQSFNFTYTLYDFFSWLKRIRITEM
jgi:hypothetical protein